MRYLTLSLFVILPLIMIGQKAEIISLPDADKTGGMPLMEALNERHSSREYSAKNLSNQQIANMLWAAWGVNRDNGKHTAPSSRNKQEMEVYMSTADGLFLYLPEKHALKKIHDKDIRAITGGQDFVDDAAVNLIFVADYRKAGDDVTADDYRCTSGTNAGFMSQNVYLWCASEGLATVVRGWFDREELHEAMGLEVFRDVILCQTVGYPAK
ncbi:MAG TPA: SagB/ThcOx family dehydrogenase [Bacteroidales bacterium]|nr:SagB/ThcOx family dehydrogenase [Bacteroidales bacterium]